MGYPHNPHMLMMLCMETRQDIRRLFQDVILVCKPLFVFLYPLLMLIEPVLVTVGSSFKDLYPSFKAYDDMVGSVEEADILRSPCYLTVVGLGLLRPLALNHHRDWRYYLLPDGPPWWLRLGDCLAIRIAGINITGPSSLLGIFQLGI